MGTVDTNNKKSIKNVRLLYENQWWYRSYSTEKELCKLIKVTCSDKGVVFKTNKIATANCALCCMTAKQWLAWVQAQYFQISGCLSSHSYW
jgi:hypothetical protein